MLFATQFCKEPSEIGLDFIDNQAGFNITDTITILAFTERDDSIPTSLTSQSLLGQMYDPVFGKTRSTIFAQFSMSPSLYGSVSWDEEPALDSILLVMAYSPRIGIDDDSTMYYGNLEILKTLKVFELEQSILNKDTIYGNQQVEGDHTLVGERVFVPAPWQRLPLGNDTLAYLGLRLHDSFGQKFIDADSIHYTNWLRFHDFFKGLKITIEDNFTQGGCMLGFNMFDFHTRLTVYYQAGIDEDRKQNQRSFRIENFSRRNTFIEHDFQNSNPIIANQLENPGEPNDSLLFVSSTGGLRGRLKLPHLEKLSEIKNIVINQAQLIIPVDEAFIQGKDFHAAHELVLMKIDENEISRLRDQEVNPTMFGGWYNREKKQYEFNIAQHIQQVLDGTVENDDLILVVRGSAQNAERVVLSGPGRTQNPMLVRIRYTYFSAID